MYGQDISTTTKKPMQKTGAWAFLWVVLLQCMQVTIMLLYVARIVDAAPDVEAAQNDNTYG